MRQTIRSAEANPLFQLFVAVGNWLFGNPAYEEQTVTAPRAPRPYVVRKRSLPNTFTREDWQRALEYWDYRCAVCGRPRGLWHTLTADHWTPLNSPDCPGTVPTNLIPLCHGQDGCNNSKSGRQPDTWLERKLGKRKAARKLAEIQTYFDWIEQLYHTDESNEQLCPGCGCGALEWIDSDIEEPGWWRCTACCGEWVEQTICEN